MLLTLLLGSLVAAAPQQTDTIIPVTAGTRLELDNPGGEINIHAWDKNSVQIKARHSSRTTVSIRSTGSVLRITASSNHGPANIVDYEISAPAWMALSLNGMYSDMLVDGTQAEVKAETLNGNIVVKGGTGTLNLHSVQGTISVQGSKGRLELNSVSEGITVVDAEGDITAETISGNIDLRRVRSKSVELGTLSGEILYDGTFQEGGQYSFVSHSGDIMMGVPDGASATFNVATLDGEVETNIPVTGMEHPTKRRTTFRIGSGSAKVDVESFNGNVKIGRPGTMTLDADSDDEN
ncbi:MAG: DUF4097 family beta strand repeat-containing protein [Gemmatimonadota bacterium]